LQSILSSGNKKRNIQAGTCEDEVMGETDFGGPGLVGVGLGLASWLGSAR